MDQRTLTNTSFIKLVAEFSIELRNKRRLYSMTVSYAKKIFIKKDAVCDKVFLTV